MTIDALHRKSFNKHVDFNYTILILISAPGRCIRKRTLVRAQKVVNQQLPKIPFKTVLRSCIFSEEATIIFSVPSQYGSVLKERFH